MRIVTVDPGHRRQLANAQGHDAICGSTALPKRQFGDGSRSDMPDIMPGWAEGGVKVARSKV
jgi:hypothetical protein